MKDEPLCFVLFFTFGALEARRRRPRCPQWGGDVVGAPGRGGRRRHVPQRFVRFAWCVGANRGRGCRLILPQRDFVEQDARVFDFFGQEGEFGSGTDDDDERAVEKFATGEYFVGCGRREERGDHFDCGHRFEIATRDKGRRARNDILDAQGEIRAHTIDFFDGCGCAVHGEFDVVVVVVVHPWRGCEVECHFVHGGTVGFAFGSGVVVAVVGERGRGNGWDCAAVCGGGDFLDDGCDGVAVGGADGVEDVYAG